MQSRRLQDSGIYRLAVQTFLTNWPICAAYIVISVALLSIGRVLDGAAGSVLLAVFTVVCLVGLFAWLAVSAHRTLLIGDGPGARQTDGERFHRLVLRFGLRVIRVWLLPILLLIVLSMVLNSLVLGRAAIQANSLWHTIAPVVLFELVAFFVLLRVGITFPEMALYGESDLDEVRARSRLPGAARQLARELLLGPIGFTLFVYLPLSIWAEQILWSGEQADLGPRLGVAELSFELATYLFESFLVVLTATVLSRAYDRIRDARPA